MIDIDCKNADILMQNAKNRKKTRQNREKSAQIRSFLCRSALFIAFKPVLPLQERDERSAARGVSVSGFFFALFGVQIYSAVPSFGADFSKSRQTRPFTAETAQYNK